MKKFRYCKKCKIYTLQDSCPKCGTKLEEFKTLKYSPEDPWQKYRIMERIKKGEISL